MNYILTATMYDLTENNQQVSVWNSGSIFVLAGLCLTYIAYFCMQCIVSNSSGSQQPSQIFKLTPTKHNIKLFKRACFQFCPTWIKIWHVIYQTIHALASNLPHNFCVKSINFVWRLKGLEVAHKLKFSQKYRFLDTKSILNYWLHLTNRPTKVCKQIRYRKRKRLSTTSTWRLRRDYGCRNLRFSL